jgi:hypothetical protein
LRVSATHCSPTRTVNILQKFVFLLYLDPHSNSFGTVSLHIEVVDLYKSVASS